LENDGTHIYQRIYVEAADAAARRGMPSLLRFHDWMPLHLMPDYYSVGAATLCIGDFIEAFGNVSLESELCGTPAIISRVGAQRSILPDAIAHKVDFGDVAATAEVLAECVRGMGGSPAARTFIQETYTQERCTSHYVDAICSTRLVPPLQARLPQPPHPGDIFEIPPWCAALGRGYYNDYEYGYCEDPELLTTVRSLAGPATRSTLLERGMQSQLLEHWARSGMLRKRSTVASSR
jgi:hypothetical protein